MSRSIQSRAEGCCWFPESCRQQHRFRRLPSSPSPLALDSNGSGDPRWGVGRRSELKFTKTTVKGNDLYRFTLTKSRTAQIEVPLTESMAFDGTTYTSFVAWTAAQDVPEVRLNLRVPRAAVIATPQAGAALLPGDANYAFYTKTVKNVKAGDQLDLAVAYSLPTVAAAAAAGAAPSGGRSVVPIALVLLVPAHSSG